MLSGRPRCGRREGGMEGKKEGGAEGREGKGTVTWSACEGG